MKISLASLLVLLCSASAFAGECSLVPPGQSDKNNHACSDPSAWGLAFEGYFFGDSPCYSSVDDARSAMFNSYACRQAGSYYGSCNLVPPGTSDQNNHSCSDPTAWGVAFQGYFEGDSPCYSDADAAMQAMVGTNACTQPMQRGHCSLLAPGLSDASSRACSDPTAWGVTYNGSFISDSPCYSSVESAMEAMNSDRACR
jgi:hypothetical protein